MASMPAQVPQIKPTVTLSWDDGHPLDLRTAKLMADCGLVGTFYIPVHITRPQLDNYQLLELCAMGMEIGSHGLTHCPLTRSENLQRELTESKEKLEQIIGSQVTSFCYPFGKFNCSTMLSARLAGYSLARTTVGFSITNRFDPFRMPVAIQFAPQSSFIHFRHAMKEGNARGFFNWGSRWHFQTALAELSRRVFDDACREQGTFHLWGHSWEIDELGLWSMLADFCQYIGRRTDVRYLTNSCVAAENAK
jgi:peptidoglycan-N-acetylglucosamine deacetylase